MDFNTIFALIIRGTKNIFAAYHQLFDSIVWVKNCITTNFIRAATSISQIILHESRTVIWSSATRWIMEKTRAWYMVYRPGDNILRII